MKLFTRKSKATSKEFKEVFHKRSQFCEKNGNKRFALIVVLVTILSAGAVEAVTAQGNNIEVIQATSSIQITSFLGSK